MSAAVGTIISGVLGLGGNIFSGVTGANAVSDAASIQAQAAADALAFQKQAYATQQGQIAPYLETGVAAQNQLAYLLGVSSGTPAVPATAGTPGTPAVPATAGTPASSYAPTGTNGLTFGSLTTGFDPTAQGIAKTFDPTQVGLPQNFSYTAADFQVDPGYQFALDQAKQAIERSAAAKGGLVSGGTLKDLTAYTEGQAAQQYNTSYSRAQSTYQQNYQDALARYQQNYSNLFNTYETNQTNEYNRLAALVGTGLTATGMSTTAGQNLASVAGNYTINAGNALAAGTVGSANATTAGVAGGTNAVTSALNAYQNQQYQQALQNALAQYRSGVVQNV